MKKNALLCSIGFIIASFSAHGLDLQTVVDSFNRIETISPVIYNGLPVYKYAKVALSSSSINSDSAHVICKLAGFSLALNFKTAETTGEMYVISASPQAAPSFIKDANTNNYKTTVLESITCASK